MDTISTDVINEIESVRNLVVSVLKEDTRARNDDNWLIYKVISRLTKIFISFEDFNKLPKFETIRRIRQKIQNEEGLYIPTDDKVIKRRKIKEGILRNYYGNEDT